jgi:hypothetical protein
VSTGRILVTDDQEDNRRILLNAAALCGARREVVS